MDQKNLIIQYNEYPGNEGLQADERELLDLAIKAAANAYAPYSKFNVGAAVRLSNGKVISASNQENAAYPSGLCAERVALFYANSTYPDSSVESIAIVATVNGKLCKTPTYPCGACRQVMTESQVRGGKPVKIIFGSETVTQIVYSTASIMPFAFDNLPE
ncbi:MAG: cytidine deaminase [Bacteroidales bacterium]